MVADINIKQIGNEMIVQGSRTYHIREKLKKIGGFSWNHRAKYWFTMNYNLATIMAVQEICANKRFSCEVDDSLSILFGIVNTQQAHPQHSYSTPSKATRSKPQRKPVSLKRKSKRLLAGTTAVPRSLYNDNVHGSAAKKAKHHDAGEVEVVRELTLDQQLEERERAAAAKGDVVDLC